MSRRLRHLVIGCIISAIALGAGLLASELFGFNWAIVSLLLLGLANIFTLAGRYHENRRNIPLLPPHLGTQRINAVIEREGRVRYVPKRHQVRDRFTSISQPMLVAVIVILLFVLL